MNRKYGIIFGAVAIVLMMVSSATAVTIPQSNESTETDSYVTTSITNCVKPGIYLNGSEYREMIADVLPYVDNPDIHLLLQLIIEMMDSKGFVDSSDIAHIINDYDLEVGTIDFGRLDIEGIGFASCPRRPLTLGLVLLPVVPLLLWYFDDIPNLGGLAIGFRGIVSTMPNGFPPVPRFLIFGRAPLIIYLGSGNQQSTPQSNPSTQSQTPIQSGSQTSTESSSTTTQTITVSTISDNAKSDDYESSIVVPGLNQSNPEEPLGFCSITVFCSAEGPQNCYLPYFWALVKCYDMTTQRSRYDITNFAGIANFWFLPAGHNYQLSLVRYPDITDMVYNLQDHADASLRWEW